MRSSIKTGRKWEEVAWPLPSCSPVSHQSLLCLQPEAWSFCKVRTGAAEEGWSQSWLRALLLAPCAGCCWVLLSPSCEVFRFTLCFHILSLPRNVFCDFNIRQPLLFRVWCKLFQIWIPVCCVYTYIWTYNFLTKMASWRTSGLATIFFMLGTPPWMSFCVSVFHYLLLTILQAVSFLTTRNSVGKSVPIFLSYLCVSFSTEWIRRREISEELQFFLPKN